MRLAAAASRAAGPEAARGSEWVECEVWKPAPPESFLETADEEKRQDIDVSAETVPMCRVLR